MRQRDNYWGPALLIMDNLRGHKNVVGAAPEDQHVFLPAHNLHILFLVAHSSDQTQPLDLGVFGNQKAICQRTTIKGDFHEFTTKILKVVTSLQKASTVVSIVNAFQAAGIVRKFNKNDGTISLVVDRSCCTRVRSSVHEGESVKWEAKSIKLPTF